MSSLVNDLEAISTILTESYGPAFLNSARDIYFLKYGKPAWDEPFYETRMNLFIEWFLLEYSPEGVEAPILRALNLLKTNQELTKTVNSLYASHYSLFDIEAPWKNKHQYLRDTIYGGDWYVYIDPEIPALDLPVLLQGRLIRNSDGITLSESCIVHPSDARDRIYELLDESQSTPVAEVLELLARLYIRRWRFPALPSSRFYDPQDPLVRDIVKRTRT
ncbi:hypothetical protein KKF34_01025 [Myxococcota bacterium]|nr:hypothetical protein [Myxococcota bacterium]MBU1381554.1 hypothetical protein [Myxococcota bacterium]MBU1495444.1 hypothetical protein [Myxococcota bacterium]